MKKQLEEKDEEIKRLLIARELLLSDLHYARMECEKANRTDLIDQTKKEIEILSSYMPELLSEEEVTKIIDEAIVKVNASTIKDMGLVMKEVSAKLKGRADMSLVSSIIKNKLN